MTVTKAKLVRKVMSLGVTGNIAKVAVQSVIDSIRERLLKGEKVQVSGFGVFYVKDRRAREARNPRTGEKVDVPAKKVVAFRPSERLKQIIKG